MLLLNQNIATFIILKSYGMCILKSYGKNVAIIQIYVKNITETLFINGSHIVTGNWCNWCVFFLTSNLILIQPCKFLV